MIRLNGRHAFVVALLLAAAMPVSAAAQQTSALEVSPSREPGLQMAEGAAAAGETAAIEKPITESSGNMLSAGSLELWRNISRNYRLAGDILLDIRTYLGEAGDDPQERLAVWEHYGPLLAEVRNRLNDLRHLVDRRMESPEELRPDEQLAYGAWQDDLYRIVALLDNDVIILDREAGYWGQLSSNVYDEAFGSGVEESPMESTPWGGQTRRAEPKPEWEYEAEFGYQAGSSTYADNASYTASFSERLKAAGGNEYEFYQDYSRDISYVESESYTIGAKQKIKDILWEGDLRLEEEFSRDVDMDDSANNLQEGEFKLRFDPEWSDGKWKADLEYRYDVKVYETFSSRSYKLNTAKAKLEHEFSKDLEGEVRTSFDDYNYSIGSDRGNSKTETGGGLDWDITNDFKVGVETSQEIKHYDVRKDRNSDEVSYDLRAEWRADDDSQLTMRQNQSYYERYYNPGENYDEHSTDLSYRRSINDKLDVDLGWSYREKEFDLDPMSDTLQRGYNYGLNYNPDREWNFSYGFDWRDYGFSDPIRQYETRGHRASSRWSHHNIGLGLDYSRSENDYSMDALRNYSRDDYNLDFDYRFDRHSVRVYYGVGYLDQADPASTNDYSETRVGASWDFDITEETQLRLSYDLSERDYDSQPKQEDNRLQAILSFRF